MNAYLAKPQSANNIINFLNSHELQDVTKLDFSGQLNAGWSAYHSTEELDSIFGTVNQRLPNVEEFVFQGSSRLSTAIFTEYPNSYYAGAPIGKYISQTRKLKSVDLTYLGLNPNGTTALAPYLVNSSLAKLKLDYSFAGDEGVMALANALPSTELESLSLYACETTDMAIESFVDSVLATPSLVYINYGATYMTEDSAKVLSKILLQPGLLNLYVSSNTYNDAALKAYATHLPQAKNLTKFAIDFVSMQETSTLVALADGIAQTNCRELRLNGFAVEPTVSNLGYLFYRLKDMPTTSLYLSGATCIDEKSAEDFQQYFPISNINYLEMYYCSNLPLSLNATQKFSNAVYQSKLDTLRIASVGFYPNTDGTLQNILLAPYLRHLFLDTNGASEELSLAIVNMLPQSNVMDFVYGPNSVTDKVLIRTAELIYQTKLNRLLFDGNEITTFGMKSLFNQIAKPNSLIKILGLYNARIGDEGTSYIASHLQNSKLAELRLINNHITDIGARSIGNALVKTVKYNLLWLDSILQKNNLQKTAATELNKLVLSNNEIGVEGAFSILANQPYTELSAGNVDLSYNSNITFSELSDLSFTSGASRRADIPWPIQLPLCLMFSLSHFLQSNVKSVLGFGHDKKQDFIIDKDIFIITFILLSVMLTKNLAKWLDSNKSKNFFHNKATFFNDVKTDQKAKTYLVLEKNMFKMNR